MRDTSLCYIENRGRYLMMHRVRKTVDENKDKWISLVANPDVSVPW